MSQVPTVKNMKGELSMNSQNQNFFDHQNDNSFNDQRTGDSNMADQDQFQSFNAFYNNQEKGNDFMNQEPFDPEIVLPGELDHVEDEPEMQTLTPEEMALLKELQQQQQRAAESAAKNRPIPDEYAVDPDEPDALTKLVSPSPDTVMENPLDAFADQLNGYSEGFSGTNASANSVGSAPNSKNTQDAFCYTDNYTILLNNGLLNSLAMTLYSESSRYRNRVHLVAEHTNQKWATYRFEHLMIGIPRQQGLSWTPAITRCLDAINCLIVMTDRPKGGPTHQIVLNLRDFYGLTGMRADYARRDINMLLNLLKESIIEYHDGDFNYKGHFLGKNSTLANGRILLTFPQSIYDNLSQAYAAPFPISLLRMAVNKAPTAYYTGRLLVINKRINRTRKQANAVSIPTLLKWNPCLDVTARRKKQQLVVPLMQALRTLTTVWSQDMPQSLNLLKGCRIENRRQHLVFQPQDNNQWEDMLSAVVVVEWAEDYPQTIVADLEKNRNRHIKQAKIKAYKRRKKDKGTGHYQPQRTTQKDQTAMANFFSNQSKQVKMSGQNDDDPREKIRRP